MELARGGAAVAWLGRVLGALLAVVVVIQGGYWETHRHIAVGMLMALLGIVSLIAVSQAPVL